MVIGLHFLIDFAEGPLQGCSHSTPVWIEELWFPETDEQGNSFGWHLYRADKNIHHGRCRAWYVGMFEHPEKPPAQKTP